MEYCVVAPAFEANNSNPYGCNKGKKIMELQQQQVKNENSQQQHQLEQHSVENFSVYAGLANYYFSNKSDIITDDKYVDENKKGLLLNQACYHINNKTNEHNDGSILTVINSNNEIITGNKLLSSIIRVDENENVIQKTDYKQNHYKNNILCKENIDNNKLSKNRKQQNKFNLNFTNRISFLLLLLLNQNASFCYRSGSSERNDNYGFLNYHYPYQSTMIPNLHNYAHHNRMRSLDTSDPLIIMPTSNNNFGGPRFVNDQNTNGPSSSSAPQLNDWTSMITSVFQKDTLDKHIKNILVPRVSGTEGNVKVRNYIVNVLKSNNYHVQLDEFSDSTPIGEVKFANIIADSNPNACRQLVIACHYDSKMMEGFLGATDSAVPCAMLLKMSETFKDSFRSNSNDNSDSDDNNQKNDLSLRFIFFDGEEAFEQWSATDSLYGSRHLAAKWEQTQAPDHCNVKNELKRIELFLILDLIGTSDTSFVMYNRHLAHHYNDMMKYEKNYLNRIGVTNIRATQAFKNRHQPLDWVEDDHVPFYRRGVPILSLLAHPFPKVWHKVTDDYSAIDFPRTRRILSVLEEFVANYKK